MNFSAPKQQLTPPERGSFPLDHKSECKPLMKDFVACLKAHSSDHIDCKGISKKYLACRMDKGLMARDDLNNLGFDDKSMLIAKEGRVRRRRHIEERHGIMPWGTPKRGRGGHN